MASYEIRILDASAEAAYAGLVAAAPDARWTHTPAWRGVLADLGAGESIVWGAFQGGALAGALPAFVRRAAPGAVLNSLPWFQGAGGVLARDGRDPDSRRELTRTLVQAMLSWCADQEVRVACVIGSAFAEYDEGVLPRAPDFRARRLIQVIDLRAPSRRHLWVRRNVKKAARHHPVLRVGSTLDDARLIYDLYLATMRRIRVAPYGFEVYRSVHERAASDPEWRPRWVWAEVDGQPVSSILLMEHRGIIDYFSVGSSDFGREIQASSWLCAEVMDREIEKGDAGARIWNWMASPGPSVYEFKQRWGGGDRYYPIWAFRTGDTRAMTALSPAEIAAHYPGYFAVPFDWLDRGSAT